MHPQKDYYIALDGLRALAIGFVLLFHSRLSWFPGGFVGVDIFFVISGFLITRLILIELATGNFSFRKFYLRRIARLMPALFVTILISLLIGAVLLDPLQLEELAEASLAALISVSNLFFWFRIDYFSPSAETQPLLHTWSLGVEEQFYVFWPLLIVGIGALSERGARRSTMLVLGIVSLALCVVVVSSDQNAVFYLMPFRVHQFVFGAALAFAGPLKSERLRGVAGIAGIAVLVVFSLGVEGGISALLIDPLAEVSAIMVLPAMATAAVIWGADSPGTRSVLGAGPLVWLGRRSYSIYLVHWPLGVYYFQIADQQTEFSSFVLVLASVLIGACLHWAIEKRFRLVIGATPLSTRKSMWVSAFLFVCVMLVSSVYKVSGGLPNRLSEEVRLAFSKFDDLVARTEIAIDHQRCMNFSTQHSSADYDRQRCAPPINGQPKYLILGDSWAANTYLLMKEAFPEIVFHRFGVAGCRLRVLSRFQAGEANYCKQLYQFAFEELIEKENYTAVIISSSWQEEYAQVAEVAAYLLERNVRPIVMGHFFIFPGSVPNTVFSSLSLADASHTLNGDADILTASTQQRDEALRQALGAGVALISPIDFQCVDQCDFIDTQNRLLYRDSNHLTEAGGQYFASNMREIVSEILAR